MRPEIDQIAGSCKNWFSVGRWADVSNQQLGVTWATLDAPMALVGSITIDRIGSVPNPKDWLDKLEPSQTLYSMVMNNHWWTNYKADQEGPTTFRYALQPHGSYDAGVAQRFGIECSQPLVVAAAQGPAPTEKPLLSIEPAGVVISSIQPIEDGPPACRSVIQRNWQGGQSSGPPTRHNHRNNRRATTLADRYPAYSSDPITAR